MSSALDIAQQTNQALERWQAVLDRLDELEALEASLGEGEHELARTRFNRYAPLLRLGQWPEAQQVLEGCLTVFREAEDLTMQAKTLSALADVWDERGDPGQAADLERQALAVRERLPNPGARAISHNNLANYLRRLGQEDQAAPHRLAALAYEVIAGHHQGMASHLRNLSIVMREAMAQGHDYPLPALPDLLARPAFDALRRFLAERGVDPAALQQALDPLIAKARDAALEA